MSQDVQQSVTINLARGLAGVAEHLVKKAHPQGSTVWNGGLGDVLKQGLKDLGVPSEELTPVEAARRMGLLPPEKKTKRRARA